MSAHTPSRCRNCRGMAALRRPRRGLAGHQPAPLHHRRGGLPRPDQDHPAGQGHDPGSGADRDVPAVPGQGDAPRLAGHRGEPARQRERGRPRPTEPGPWCQEPVPRSGRAAPGRPGPAAGPTAARLRGRAGGPVPAASMAGLRVPGFLRPFRPGLVRQPGRLGTVGPLAHEPEPGLAVHHRAGQQLHAARAVRCRGPIGFVGVSQQAARACSGPFAQAAQVFSRPWPGISATHPASVAARRADVRRYPLPRDPARDMACPQFSRAPRAKACRPGQFSNASLRDGGKTPEGRTRSWRRCGSNGGSVRFADFSAGQFRSNHGTEAGYHPAVPDRAAVTGSARRMLAGCPGCPGAASWLARVPGWPRLAGPGWPRAGPGWLAQAGVAYARDVYLPPHFAGPDAAAVAAFVAAAAAADLVTFDGAKPVASLIPVLWDREPGSPAPGSPEPDGPAGRPRPPARPPCAGQSAVAVGGGRLQRARDRARAAGVRVARLVPEQGPARPGGADLELRHRALHRHADGAPGPGLAAGCGDPAHRAARGGAAAPVGGQ